MFTQNFFSDTCKRSAATEDIIQEYNKKIKLEINSNSRNTK